MTTLSLAFWKALIPGSCFATSIPLHANYLCMQGTCGCAECYQCGLPVLCCPCEVVCHMSYSWLLPLQVTLHLAPGLRVFPQAGINHQPLSFRSVTIMDHLCCTVCTAAVPHTHTHTHTHTAFWHTMRCICPSRGSTPQSCHSASADMLNGRPAVPQKLPPE